MCRGNTQGVYPLGYVPHNPHFLWFAASMEGAARSRRKRGRADRRTRRPARTDAAAGICRPAALLDDALVRQRALRALGRNCGRAQSGPDLPYVTAIWHYAQAWRDIRRDRRSRTNMTTLAKLAADPALNPDGLGSLSAVAHAADRDARVRAELAPAAKDGCGDRRTAQGRDHRGRFRTTSRRAGIRRSASRSARCCCGRRRGRRRGGVSRGTGAQPDNGWSLYGLARSLRAQGKEAEAAKVDARFKTAWQHADVKLASSRF